MLAPLHDLFDPLAVTVRQGLFLVALEELRETEDGIERSAKLMAHQREEIALGAAPRLGRQPRLAQLFRGADVGGQIPDGLDDTAVDRPPIVDAQGSPVARTYFDGSVGSSQFFRRSVRTGRAPVRWQNGGYRSTHRAGLA